MKFISSFLFMLLISSIGFSQTVSITGTVKDQQGQPVPLALVRDAQHHYATMADSIGAFLLKADPSSMLITIAPGYTDSKVKIDNKASIAIVMQRGASS